LFTIDDDPFEVRLRANYELMLDEYFESRVRAKLLDDRLADIGMRGKIDEMTRKLTAKNAQVYVQRCATRSL
jgi:hypothetical protein